LPVADDEDVLEHTTTHIICYEYARILD